MTTATRIVFEPTDDTIVTGEARRGKTQCVTLPAFTRWAGPTVIFSASRLRWDAMYVQLVPVDKPLEPLQTGDLRDGIRVLVESDPANADSAQAVKAERYVLQKVLDYSAGAKTPPLVILEDYWANVPVLTDLLHHPKEALRLVVVGERAALRARLGDALFGELLQRCTTAIDFDGDALKLGGEPFGLAAVTTNNPLGTETTGVVFTPFFAMQKEAK